jgi:hypothetical protein
MLPMSTLGGEVPKPASAFFEMCFGGELRSIRISVMIAVAHAH